MYKGTVSILNGYLPKHVPSDLKKPKIKYLEQEN